MSAATLALDGLPEAATLRGVIAAWAAVAGRQLRPPASLAVPAEGSLGLWVDIGTRGYFADLRVTLR